MQSTARHFEPVECAYYSMCGGTAEPGRIYCRECRRGRGPRYLSGQAGEPDPEVEAETLRERLAGGGKHTRRIAKYGHRSCIRCEEPAMPGRLYCSSRCRFQVPVEIELDGVTMTPIKHAARRGIGHSTFYRRLQLGLSVEEALARPIDEAMRRRAS